MKTLKKLSKKISKVLQKLRDQKDSLYNIREDDLIPLVSKGILIRRLFETKNPRDARTLRPEDLGQDDHGWIVEGPIHEDYYEWVNEFVATHESGHVIFGDFESFVYATSEEALEDFLKYHEPSEWDYWDI